MYTLILVLHLTVCVFLIFIVLIQSSKGAELGAAFGGSNQTLFGSRGAATFLTKLTTVAAIVFMLTSLTLAFYSIKRGSIVLGAPVKQVQGSKKTLPDTKSGPLQEKPLTPVQGETQDNPLQPAEPVK